MIAARHRAISAIPIRCVQQVRGKLLERVGGTGSPHTEHHQPHSDGRDPIVFIATVRPYWSLRVRDEFSGNNAATDARPAFGDAMLIGCLFAVGSYKKVDLVAGKCSYFVPPTKQGERREKAND